MKKKYNVFVWWEDIPICDKTFKSEKQENRYYKRLYKRDLRWASKHMTATDKWLKNGGWEFLCSQAQEVA